MVRVRGCQETQGMVSEARAWVRAAVVGAGQRPRLPGVQERPAAVRQPLAHLPHRGAHLHPGARRPLPAAHRRDPLRASANPTLSYLRPQAGKSARPAARWLSAECDQTGLRVLAAARARICACGLTEARDAGCAAIREQGGGEDGVRGLCVVHPQRRGQNQRRLAGVLVPVRPRPRPRPHPHTCSMPKVHLARYQGARGYVNDSKCACASSHDPDRAYAY